MRMACGSRWRSCRRQPSPTKSSIASNASEMDAKDELRRLLRQRLEDGESTIVLESLDAKDAKDAIAACSVIPSSARDPHLADGNVQIPPARDDKTRETLEQRRSVPAEGSGDWRAAL